MMRFKPNGFRSVLRAGTLGLLLAATLLTAQSAFAFKIVGYFPSWQGQVDAIEYDKVTHINYSFLLPNPDGSLQPLGGGTARLDRLVNRAHGSGVKVLIAVGGWNGGDDSAFVNLAANPAYRSNFVNNLVRFVERHNLDGVDMDWEYPDAGTEANNFRLLMTELSNALHSRGKLLTAAVTSEDQRGSVGPEVISAVDFLNLMVYDLGNPHSTFAHAQSALNHWRYNEGLPKEKAILGVPFYSHVDWVPYKDIIARHGDWASQHDSVGNLDYNGQPTIRAKTELALNESGGMMIWELSQDTHDHTSLLGTIWDVAGDAVGGGTDPGTGDPEPPTDYPDWQSSAQYEEGDVVRYEGNLYIAEHANPGYNPVVSTWYWDPYDGGGGTALEDGATYRIIARHSGKALDVEGVSAANGANLHQWDYVGGNNQKWVAESRGQGLWQLRSVHSGKCLDVRAWGTANGDNLIQWDCHGGDNQLVSLVDQGDGYVNIRIQHSGKCVDVSGASTSNGGNIQQWECVGQDNAEWRFEALP